MREEGRAVGEEVEEEGEEGDQAVLPLYRTSWRRMEKMEETTCSATGIKGQIASARQSLRGAYGPIPNIPAFAVL